MKIKMENTGFRDVEFGDDKLLKVSSAAYNETTHTLRITFQDETKASISQFFKLYKKDKDGGLNAEGGAFRRLAVFLKALTGQTPDEFDPDDLIGCYMVCDVVASQQTRDDGTPFTNLNNIQPTDATFDDDETPVITPEIDSWD